MSLLTVVQHFCRRTNIPVPTTVTGSSEPQVTQLMALLEEEGIDLAQRGDWQELTFEATHTTIAAEDQGAVSTIAANGFDHFKQNSFWDRTLRLPVIVLDGQDWQASKAITTTGPRYQARVRGGKLLANPVPAAGNTWSFEYVSKNWILGADGTTYKQFFTLDTDTILLPELVVIAGLRWRWKKEKGTEYAEDFRTYENLVSKALGHNGLRSTLDMGACPESAVPGVLIPETGWAVP